MSLYLFKKNLRKIKPVFHVTPKGMIRGRCNKCPAVIASGQLGIRNKSVGLIYHQLDLGLSMNDINLIISAADNDIEHDYLLSKWKKRQAKNLRKFLLSFVR